ncbi:hypothetical protein D9M69_485600 [compost metagenome]
MAQTAVQLAEHGGVGEVHFVADHHLGRYRDRRVRAERPGDVQGTAADLLLRRAVGRRLYQPLVEVGLIQGAVDTVLRECHRHVARGQGENDAGVMHGRRHRGGLLHHQLRQPDLRAFPHADPGTGVADDLDLELVVLERP